MRIGRMGRAVVTTALLAATLTPGTVVHGAPPKGFDDQTYHAAVARRIDQVSRSGNQAAVDRMLEREFGWVKVAGDDDLTDDGLVALGTPSGSDVSLYKPSLYRNTQLGRYEVVGRWQWKSCGALYCWAANYGDAYGYDGGPDGVGVTSNVGVNFVTSSLVTFTERGAMYVYTNPDELDQYGAGYSEQDRRYHARDFTWDHGTVMFAFNIKTCSGMRGTQWIFRQRMSHTWGDQGVASVSVSAGIVDFSFSSSSSPRKWSVYGNSVLSWYACG